MTERDPRPEKKGKNKPSRRHQPTEPVNLIDGIPDRSTRRAVWKYVLIIAVFLFWLGVLVTIQIAGRPR